MGDRTAFFYGTLMAPGVLYRVIYGTSKPEPWQTQSTTIQPALLKSYRRHRVKFADFPAIIPHEDPDSDSEVVVRGTYVTGLNDQDVRRLDIFEGEMYKRMVVRVRVLETTKDGGEGEEDVVDDEHMLNGDGDTDTEVDAETYVWAMGKEYLEEKEWDFKEFQREKMKAWMGEEGCVVDGVEVDEGFADVDRDREQAVKDEEEGQRENENGEEKGFKGDPSGGRINGSIAKELKNAAL